MLLQGTEGVVGLAWASIDDTCRLNYNVRMEVIVVLVVNINDSKDWLLQGADISTATSSLELEDYPVQNLKVVKSSYDGHS